MRLYRSYFLFLIQFFISLPNTGQVNEIAGKNYKAESFSVEKGLSHSHVTSIAQDDDGFIWIGTEFGLLKYNGYDFESYFSEIGESSTLSRSFIKDLCFDNKGKLWVATWGGGINIFDPNNQKFSNFNEVLSPYSIAIHKNIEFINNNRNESYWIGTFKGLVYYSSLKKQVDVYLHNPDENTSISDNRLVDMIEDKSGTYAFVCDDGVMNLFQPKTKSFKRNKISDHRNIFKIVPITCLEEFSEQEWIVGTQSGLYLFNKSEMIFTKVDVRDSANMQLNTSHVKRIHKDSNGNFWISMNEGGVFRMVNHRKNKKHTTIISLNKIIQNETVNDILTDNQGNIWFGTTDKGIRVIYNKLENINTPKIETEPVYAVTKDENHNLWLGTVGGGLYKYNLLTGAQKKYTTDSGLLSNIIRSVFVDSYNRLLIGTMEGLNILDIKSGEISTWKDENEILNSEIVKITKDNNGNYWIGSVTNGLVYIDAKTGEISNYSPSSDVPLEALGNENVRSACFDSQGRLWVAIHGGGVNLFDPEKKEFTRRFLNNPDDKRSLNDNKVLDLYIDSEDKIWVGTREGGFNQFLPDSGIFINYQTQDGMPSNAVSAILEDNNKDLWISTYNGITRFNKETKTFKNFDRSDGLLNSIFINGSKFKDENGLLYFGSWDTKNNVSIIDPDAISYNIEEPKLKFTDFRIFNRPVEIGGENSPLQKHISKTDAIELKYDQTAISLDYVALNYISSNKNQYAFKMEGLEEEWREVGQLRSANYSNLPHGEYIFKIKASNNDGVWTKEPLSLYIKVLPPFWKSDLAYGIYIILFLGLNVLIIWFARWLTRKQHDLKLIQVEREKEKQLSIFKLQFFTNISHELRTHLTLIIYPVNRLIKKFGDSGQDRNELDQIDLNAKRLLKLTDEIMDFRKAEQGKTKLKLHKTNIITYLHEVEKLFIPVAEEHGINFEFSVSDPEIDWVFDPEQLKKVIFNLLSNALKYTPGQGTVKFYAKLIKSDQNENDLLRIGVKDNGIGIDKNYLPNIFDRFFNPGEIYKQHEMHESSGIGLAVAKQLVELHQGQMYVESSLGEGSHFYFDLTRLHSDNFEIESVQQIKPAFQDGYEKWEEILTIERNNIQDEAADILEDKVDDQPTVLVVDDNPEICQMFQEILSKSYKILIANNGEMALEIVEKENIEIVVSDIMMPVMDGITLCNRLKEEIKTSHIPIVLVTAKSGIDNELVGLRSGADAYITKPFDEDKLKLTLKNILKSIKAIQKFFEGSEKRESVEVVINPLDKKLITKIESVINENIAEAGFSVDELGKEVGLSRMHLYRKLRALTGTSPSDMIAKARIEKSKILIQNGELSISEVAYEAGYSSPGNFSTAFKKNMGITPGQYKNSLFKPTHSG